MQMCLSGYVLGGGALIVSASFMLVKDQDIIGSTFSISKYSDSKKCSILLQSQVGLPKLSLGIFSSLWLIFIFW